MVSNTANSASVAPSSRKTERKPFIQVVQEWTNSIEQKFQNRNVQNTNRSSDAQRQSQQQLPTLTVLEDNRSFEELLPLMEELPNSQAQILFACKNGTDAVSLQLLNHILERQALKNNHHHHHNTLNLGGSSSSNTGSKTAAAVPLSKIKDKDTCNCSLMHICAQRNKPQCMELLLQHKIPVDVLDSLSATPLHYAVSQNSEEAAGFLLSKGANINAKDSYSKFPLLLALKNKHYHMVEILASFRTIDVNLRGTKGNTALHFMAEEGDLTAVKFLVQKLGASPLRKNNDEENVLFNCMAHVEIVQFLASHFSANNGLGRMVTNTNISNRNLLHRCGADGHIDNILLLLRYMKLGDLSQSQISSFLNTIDKGGDTPLMLAVKNSRREFCQFLCECSEVELNEGDSNGLTALQYAVNSGDKNLIASLSNAGGSLKPVNRHDEEVNTNCCVEISRSMTTILTIVLSFIAIVCVISMAGISLGFHGSNVTKNSKKDRDHSFDEVMSFIDSRMQMHTVSILSAGAAFSSNLINTTSSRDLLGFTLANLRILFNESDFTNDAFYFRKDGAQIVAISPNGRDTQLADSTENPDVFKFYDLPSLFTGTIDEILDSTPPRLANASHNDKFGIYYKAANQSMTPVWTTTYAQLSFSGMLYMAFVVPFIDPVTGTMEAAYASDITTEAIAYFLKKKAEDLHSTIAIIEKQTGYLVSTSDPLVEVYSMNSTSTRRYNGETSVNELMNKLVHYSRANFGGRYFDKVNGKGYGSFRHKGDVYYVNIGEFKDPYGADWIILQAVPRSLFFINFRRSVGIMVGVTVALLITGVVISIISATFFMSPLKKLAALAETIKLLRLEEVERSLDKNVSFFSEIRSLQRSFGSMSLRLKQFRQFIPSHILAVIETEVAHKEILLTESQAGSKKSSKGSHKIGDVELKTMSDNMSDTKYSASSANYHSKGLIANALTSGLVSGSITVLTIHFSELSELLESYTPADVNEATKDLLTAIKDIVRDSNAQLVSHTHSDAVIAWNTLIAQPDHRIRGVRAADKCHKAITQLQDRWRTRGLPQLEMFIGVACGPSFYGNIGSDATKIFTVVGRSTSMSKSVCNLNATWGTRILCSQDIYQAAKDEFYMRPVDRFKDDVLFYELGEARNTEEWTHELEQQVPKENDKWFEFIKAFKLYDRREYEEASEILVRYLTVHPYDVAAQKLVDRCRVFSNERTSETETERTDMNME